MKNESGASGKPVTEGARKVSLVEPTAAGFVVLGISTGAWKTPFPPRRAQRRQALASLSNRASALRGTPGVREATVFSAILRPPGQPKAGEGPAAAYDVVLLAVTDSPAIARDIADAVAAETPSAAATERLVLAGSNVRSMGPVSPSPGGVFLFNFFTGPTMQATLDAWQYTAGWFERQTRLDNSTVILPDAQSHSPFPIINHCRWNSLRQVLPSLLFKRSFRSFVLAAFNEASVVPHPILYRVHS